jgi:hypothetical protein
VKRKLSILFIGIVVINLFGVYLGYLLQQIQLHTQMSRILSQMPDNKLEKITLSITAYKHLQTVPDEVRVNGEMYDVKHSEVQGDSIVLFAKHDGKETDLIEGFLSFIEEDESETKGSKVTPAPVQQDFVLPATLLNISSSTNTKIVQLYNTVLLNTCMPVACPPPDTQA